MIAGKAAECGFVIEINRFNTREQEKKLYDAGADLVVNDLEILHLFPESRSEQQAPGTFQSQWLLALMIADQALGTVSADEGKSSPLTHSGTYWVGRQIQKIPWLGDRLVGKRSLTEEEIDRKIELNIAPTLEFINSSLATISDWYLTRFIGGHKKGDEEALKKGVKNIGGGMKRAAALGIPVGVMVSVAALASGLALDLSTAFLIGIIPALMTILGANIGGHYAHNVYNEKNALTIGKADQPDSLTRGLKARILNGEITPFDALKALTKGLFTKDSSATIWAQRARLLIFITMAANSPLSTTG